jgi:hypothetical protein
MSAVVFKYSFYDHPLVQTKPIELYRGDLPKRNSSLGLNDQQNIWPAIFYHDDSVGVQFSHTVHMKDCSYSRRNFIHYMHHCDLIVEVYDAHSMFLVGHVDIPLRIFLRQGRSSIEYSLGYDIVASDVFNDSSELKVMGQVFIRLFNVGKDKDPNPIARPLGKVIQLDDHESSVVVAKRVILIHTHDFSW